MKKLSIMLLAIAGACFSISSFAHEGVAFIKVDQSVKDTVNVNVYAGPEDVIGTTEASRERPGETQFRSHKRYVYFGATPFSAQGNNSFYYTRSCYDLESVKQISLVYTNDERSQFNSKTAPICEK